MGSTPDRDLAPDPGVHQGAGTGPHPGSDAGPGADLLPAATRPTGADLLLAAALLSDADLTTQVRRLARREREATVALIAHLAELDRRRLYLAAGYSSLFTYCTRVLHLSEHAAYRRIEAARLARRLPVVLERLAEGTVTLTTIGLLAAHLTPENHLDLLDRVRHRSRRQAEALVAALRPQPPVPTLVRKLPTPSHAAPPRAASQALAPLVTPKHVAGGTLQPSPDGQDSPVPAALSPGPGTLSPGPGAPPPVTSTPYAVTAAHSLAPEATVPAAPVPAISTHQVSPERAARPPVVAPLAPQHYRVQLTVGPETVRKLREAQALLRHQTPDGDPAKILDRALTVLLRELARQKFGATDRPRPSPGTAAGSRHIPAEVRRAVWARDGGRCAFLGDHGRRCAERSFLEFHHLVPHAAGGAPTADNIQLRCRAHNNYEAERYFGPTGPTPVR